MAKEIERKFLVNNDSYKSMAERRISITQAYLSTSVNATVRIRITDETAYLTIKSKTHGIERDEWEYEIPSDDARDMLKCCTAVIEKERYIVPYGGWRWEVDSFGGRHQGLVIAEVELPSADTMIDALPPFVGEEVTGDPRYYNSMLAKGSF